jgi:integral membrane sensor domain MASE1
LAFVPSQASRVPSRRRAAAEALLVAVLYYASSRIAMRFVPGSGLAAAVWPASGIMLAAVLLVGPRIWPGIVLGAFAVLLETNLALEGSSRLFVPVVTSLTIGLGAAAQAVVGGFSVRRLAGFPNTLANGSDVLRFLLLGGPVSCLIRPSIAVASLAIFGEITQEEILFSFVTWWIADSLGTTLFAPLALLWCDGGVSLRWRRKVSVSVPLILTLGLTLVLFEQVGARDRERAEAEMLRRTDDVAQRLRTGFDSSLDSLESLGGFFDCPQTGPAMQGAWDAVRAGSVATGSCRRPQSAFAR